MLGPPIGRIARGKLSDILLPFLRSFAIRLKECLDGRRIVGIEFDERFLGDVFLGVAFLGDVIPGGVILGSSGFLGPHRLRIKRHKADGQNRELSPLQKVHPQDALEAP